MYYRVFINVYYFYILSSAILDIFDLYSLSYFIAFAKLFFFVLLVNSCIPLQNNHGCIINQTLPDGLCIFNKHFWYYFFSIYFFMIL